jgi:putative ABC transport system permease protein
VFLPYGTDITPNAFLVRSAADPLKLAPAIRARIAAIDGTIAVNRFLTLDQIRDRAAWRERFFAALVACFSAFALTLAAVGFYAMLSYVVTLQRREIGIRIALGASGAGVRRMVATQGLRLASLGLALGVLAAAGLTRLLRSQLFEVSPTDAAAWSAALAVFTAVAVLAALAPARRAALVDPVIALREE